MWSATRRNGTLKYGVGLNMEQEITKDIGVFSRLGWNDGKTESFAFTAIDRLATGGVSVTGTRWHRPFDTVATEFTASGISGVHAQYLALGGHDFLIGDGRLRIWAGVRSGSHITARVCFLASSPASICSMLRIRPTTSSAAQCGFPRFACISKSERIPTGINAISPARAASGSPTSFHGSICNSNAPFDFF